MPAERPVTCTIQDDLAPESLVAVVGRGHERIENPKHRDISGAQLRRVCKSGPVREVWEGLAGSCANEVSIFVPAPMWVADSFGPDMPRTIPAVPIQIAFNPERGVVPVSKLKLRGIAGPYVAACKGARGFSRHEASVIEGDHAASDGE